jgi:hypothetical protein
VSAWTTITIGGPPKHAFVSPSPADSIELIADHLAEPAAQAPVLLWRRRGVGRACAGETPS